MRIAYSNKGKEKIFDSPKSQILIGRAKLGLTLDLDLADPQRSETPDRSVSRPHARVGIDARKHYWIEDLGSKHGTRVGGVNIKGQGRHPLEPGQLVKIGKTTLRVLEDRVAPTLPVHLEVECPPTVNYSLVHADLAFLKRVTVANAGETLLSGLSVQLVLPGLAESEPARIPTLPANGRHALDPLPRLLFDHLRMRDLPEREQVRMETWVDGEAVPIEPARVVAVLPPNAWHCVGHEVALAGFVMPESDAIKQLESEAHSELRRQLKGAGGFADALESADPKALEKTLKAVYCFLRERYAISYEYEPRNFAEDWQRVRFHHQVLDTLEGTCIDLVLLFAAALESVHRDPLILIVRTAPELHHALIGCWREGTPRLADGTPRYGTVLRDQEQVRQWIVSGEILVLEAIGFSHSEEYPEGMRFDACRKQARGHATTLPLVYALDIVAAREQGVTPMPFGKGVQFDRTAWLARYRARQAAERLESPALGARHLLLGLLSLEGGLMRRLFARFGNGLADQIREALQASHPRAVGARRALSETAHWRAVMECAGANMTARGGNLMSEADLARALFETKTGIEEVLAEHELTRMKCLEMLDELLGQGLVLSLFRRTGCV